MRLPGPHSLQLYAFALCALTGMGLGAALDLYRAARAAGQPGPGLTTVGDVLFVAVGALAVARVLWVASAGELRLYMLAAVASGAASYFWLASPVVLPPVRWLWRGIFRLLRPLGPAARRLGQQLTQLGRIFRPGSEM